MNLSILKTICPVPINFSHIQFLPSNMVQHQTFQSHQQQDAELEMSRDVCKAELCCDPVLS